MLKWCAYAKHEVDVSLFCKNRARPDGLDTRCKPCNKQRRLDNIESVKANSIKNSKRRRKELIEDLGGKCACCSEDTYEFLQIDHITNNGGEYRKELNRKSLNTADLRTHMNELMVLCANCHLAKSSWGACPHITWNKIFTAPITK